VRRLLVAAALLAVTAATALAAGETIRFPRGHYAHPGAGIEWWYLSGEGDGSDGHRYSVFFALFRRGALALPVSQVVDLTTGRIVAHSESVGPAAFGRSALNVVLPAARLSYSPAANTWRIAASSAGYELSLSAAPVKPYVLHGGGGGVISQSTGGPSAYYSATRMRASGTIDRGGVRVALTGAAWLDHQWGDFVNDRAAFYWDWFACRFSDDTELMAYRFLTPGGLPLSRYEEGTFVSADGTGRRVTSFSALPGVRRLRAEGRTWPLDWSLAVPSEHLSLRLRSLAPDQLVRGTILPPFWEGAASATGTKQGACFVEEAAGSPATR
jgi:predicted secreted hydrolase